MTGVCIQLLLNVWHNCTQANSATVTDIRPEDWDSLMSTNLRGAFFVAQEAADRMIDAKVGGSIVNIASILGLRPQVGLLTYAVVSV